MTILGVSMGGLTEVSCGINNGMFSAVKTFLSLDDELPKCEF